MIGYLKLINLHVLFCLFAFFYGDDKAFCFSGEMRNIPETSTSYHQTYELDYGIKNDSSESYGLPSIYVNNRPVLFLASAFATEDSVFADIIKNNIEPELFTEFYDSPLEGVVDTIFIEACDTSMVAVRVMKVIINPSWMGKRTLRWGMIGTFSLAQALTGAIEGYHYGDQEGYLVTNQNYHFFEFAKRITWLTTGFMTYANFRDASLSLRGKTRRFMGSVLVARNFFEWSYKWQRYNDPFDYSRERNRHAIVYFGIKDGRIVDLYIGVGPRSGPIVDLSFLLGGLLIFK